MFGVPRATLTAKIKGVYLEDCRSGRSTILTEAKETILVNWILSVGETGSPVTKDQLLDSVAFLIKKLKRQNDPHDDRPGRKRGCVWCVLEVIKTEPPDNAAQKVQLQRKLLGLKYMEDTPLHAFLTNFEQVVYELKAAGEKIENNEVISQMPESYQSITPAIDVIFSADKTKVTLDFVKGKLLLEESRQLKSRLLYWGY
ncbi:hypothetical protein ILUMI_12108 [Ignelater luminosus]|uniref:Uncharacterized protein n=1 Tax=Ignelater luminosus TaxID=2038154 RepID=A0A8K0D0Y0_IGNLU|nr:hypothetical protein ILUMI_12108 [Ignelater luminosus]